MNQVNKMSLGPPPLAPRTSAVTTPSPLTVKMNGSIPPPPLPVSRNLNGLPPLTVGSPGTVVVKQHVSTTTGSNTPTKQPYELMANGLVDGKLMLNHSALHDTSQELMSRSVLSAASGVVVVGGPRLRTPNPNPTPTPTAPSNTTLTGTIPSPTLMISPLIGMGSGVGGGISGGGGSTTSATKIMHDSMNDAPLTSTCNDHTLHCNLSVHDVLSSLALLAVVSVLLASLAVVFLLKVMTFAVLDHEGKPIAATSQGLCNVTGSNYASRIVDANEFRLVYEIVVGLTTCTISLDFTCLLICCAQFIFASKLAKTSHGKERSLQYLKQSSCSRVIAIGGFFISIPVLLTGIILYAFIQFEAKSAIITSLLIGLSIVFCGLAMIHNVYVWQQQKTKAVRKLNIHRAQTPLELKLRVSNSEQSSSQGLDVTQNASMELSTLV